MSIKNDIAMVREELTSEEKFFEKSVITERFIKKYKNVLIGGAVVIVVFIAGNILYDANKESTAVAANEALSKLFVEPKNTTTLASLKTLSPSLYDAFVYSQAVANNNTQSLESLKSSSSVVISDLASYELSHDISSLNAYTLKQDAIYKDLAQVQAAVVLLKNGNTQKAHEKLLLISDNSPLSKVAHSLLHYGVK